MQFADSGWGRKMWKDLERLDGSGGALSPVDPQPRHASLATSTSGCRTGPLPRLLSRAGPARRFRPELRPPWARAEELLNADSSPMPPPGRAGLGRLSPPRIGCLRPPTPTRHARRTTQRPSCSSCSCELPMDAASSPPPLLLRRPHAALLFCFYHGGRMTSSGARVSGAGFRFHPALTIW
jgi:hypothetical protein